MEGYRIKKSGEQIIALLNKIPENGDLVISYRTTLQLMDIWDKEPISTQQQSEILNIIERWEQGEVILLSGNEAKLCTKTLGVLNVSTSHDGARVCLSFHTAGGDIKSLIWYTDSYVADGSDVVANIWYASSISVHKQCYPLTGDVSTQLKSVSAPIPSYLMNAKKWFVFEADISFVTDIAEIKCLFSVPAHIPESGSCQIGVVGISTNSVYPIEITISPSSIEVTLCGDTTISSVKVRKMQLNAM